MPDIDEAVTVAAELLRDIEEEDEAVESHITLSTGVILKSKRFPLWALRDAQRKLKEPEVPFYFREEKGREEPNPDDPRYLAELSEYENKLSDVALNIALMLGCDVVSIPPEISGPDDDEWIETCLFLEVIDEQQVEVIRRDPRRRRITWLRYFAISTEQDIARVMSGPVKKTLVSEEDVTESMRSFPNRQTRRESARRAPHKNGVDGD